MLLESIQLLCHSLEAILDHFRERRELLLQRLNAIKGGEVSDTAELVGEVGCGLLQILHFLRDDSGVWHNVRGHLEV